MSIAWLHLSVSPVAFSFHLHLLFEPLDWNSQLHLALVSLLRTAACQLPSASLIYISQFHLSCAYPTCTSHFHLSHLNLWMAPLMCTSQFHLWYATLTSAFSCTSPWIISFAIQFSFETLIRASWLHSLFLSRGCTWHLYLLLANCQVHLSRAAFVYISQLQLSLEPLVQLPYVPRSFTSRLNLSLVAFALTCQWHRSFSPLT